MKKVLLIGDSIRRGYDKYIKKIFEDKAEIFYPDENCRFSSYVLRYIPMWKDQLEIEDVDLVHWNAGLWDSLILYDGENHISLEEYKKNIERICKMLKHYFPKAKMIFATSTPVIEELFTGDVRRSNKDIEAYNTAAVEIVQRYDAQINDLYSLLKNAPREYHSDQTHWYTRGGTELITEQVRKVLEENLSTKGKDLNYDSYFSKEKNIVGI